uniref:Translocon-associated protein subunit beta n=1 Tax=Mesocestoides corti TaxID=53468 RepID=A0A5K3ETP6_MESCO
MNFVSVLTFCFICSVGASVTPGSQDHATLAVSKEILNRYLVEAKEVTILYTIYNLSPMRTARDIEIHDNLPESDFTFVHGSRSTRWASIPPSTNITHSVIVIPRSVGLYNFTSAEVTYKAGPDSTVTYGYSSAPGMRQILVPSVFNRQFSSHWMEWICFAFIMAPCSVVPYMLWRSSASKYM